MKWTGCFKDTFNFKTCNDIVHYKFEGYYGCLSVNQENGYLKYMGAFMDKARMIKIMKSDDHYPNMSFKALTIRNIFFSVYYIFHHWLSRERLNSEHSDHEVNAKFPIYMLEKWCHLVPFALSTGPVSQRLCKVKAAELSSNFLDSTKTLWSIAWRNYVDYSTQMPEEISLETSEYLSMVQTQQPLSTRSTKGGQSTAHH